MVVLLVLLWCWTVLVVRVVLIVRVELIVLAVLVWLVAPTAVGAGWSSGTTRPDG
ncbi:hypothetical protein [Curtobacterium sp. SGAir0471]|uniref:hypothetical protein n=1 Tax=Curtobacterium sp. SGAir0471 TaxID=2070337 RepID=UPI0015863D1F|nr:hypothetical protein [Curtobacterium sp. SGAir0471]